MAVQNVSYLNDQKKFLPCRLIKGCYSNNHLEEVDCQFIYSLWEGSIKALKLGIRKSFFLYRKRRVSENSLCSTSLSINDFNWNSLKLMKLMYNNC